MSRLAAEQEPRTLPLANGVPAAVGYSDFESGLCVIRGATVGPFAPDMPDMAIDCSVAVVGSRVAVASLLNTKTFSESRVAQEGRNIRLHGVQKRIDTFAGALDALAHTRDKVRQLQVARFSLKVLCAGQLFGKFAMHDDRYEQQLLDSLQAYHEVMFDTEKFHPALAVAKAHLSHTGIMATANKEN